MSRDRFSSPRPADRFQWMETRLGDLRATDNLRRLVVRDYQGTLLLQGDRQLVNFGSNDYLGIAMQSSIADRRPVLPGSGAGASALVCGYSSLHERLSCQLAGLESTESAVLFPTGFAACSGTVAALAEAGDLVLSDALNHASLIDGCRLSKAERFIYPNRDVKAVAALLKNHRHRYRRAFLITDSIFSMDGTRAPLEELVDLAEQYDTLLIVDEAHATGVLGEEGGGLCEQLGLADRVPIRIGTLSKAIGAHGGFVAAPRMVTDYLLQTARPLIFSTAAPPSVIQAALDGLEIIADEPQRRARVLSLAARLQEQLRSAGMVIHSQQTPIVALILGEEATALRYSADLASEGFYVPAIRPPTVPPGTARLRISLSAAHRDEQVEGLIAALLRLHAG